MTFEIAPIKIGREHYIVERKKYTKGRRIAFPALGLIMAGDLLYFVAKEVKKGPS